MALNSTKSVKCLQLFQQVMKSHQMSARLGSTAAGALDHTDRRYMIGKREVVGFGYNGSWNYMDRGDYPFPAVRFREPSKEIMALREKEKGDWKKLSLEEKKTLYRYSFCKTLSETYAPRGLWKLVIATCLFGMSSALWLMMGLRKFVFPPLPESMSPENQEKQLRYFIEMQANPIEGLASKWDYENNRWKD